MIVPEQVMRKVNNWCKKSKREQYGKELQLLNNNKEPFYWENEELSEYSGLVEKEERKHRKLTEEIPGLEKER